MSDAEKPPELDIPQLVSPLSPEELAKLKAVMPTSPGSSIELEGMAKNLPELLGAILAFWEKKMYAVLERTGLDRKEIPIFTGLIHTASHGIGGEALDWPEVEVGERVVYELEARRSLRGVPLGASSVLFDNVTTAWMNVLRQIEAQKIKDQQSAMVGLK